MTRLRRWSRGAGAAALTAWLCGGCAESTTPTAEPCADDQEVTVQVGPGTQPAFTWSPACAMTSILVFPVDSPPAVWVVYGGSRAASNPLHSGLRYGQAPTGTFEATPAAALQVGTEYEVLLNRWIGDSVGGGPFQRGYVRFTP
jgi:hypothetical protein